MSKLSDPPPGTRLASLVIGVDEEPPSKFLIHGVTLVGKTFRPSDWYERLCGVLAPYRPGAHAHEAPPIDFSPYARPVVSGGARCVMVDARLGEVEPMALRFVLNFARDNQLVTTLVGGSTLPPAKQGSELPGGGSGAGEGASGQGLEGFASLTEAQR